MKYPHLISRISELSRNFFARGGSGATLTGSKAFVVGFDIQEFWVRKGAPPLGWVKIGEDGVYGTYQIVSLEGRVINVDKPFEFTSEDLEWEVFDVGITEEQVRTVLALFPDVIMECEEGKQIKTPLGAIKIVRRKRKRVRDPYGNWSFSPERLQARLRPGKKLQIQLESVEDANVVSADPNQQDPQPLS